MRQKISAHVEISPTTKVCNQYCFRDLIDNDTILKRFSVTICGAKLFVIDNLLPTLPSKYKDSNSKHLGQFLFNCFCSTVFTLSRILSQSYDDDRNKYTASSCNFVKLEFCTKYYIDSIVSNFLLILEDYKDKDSNFHHSSK